LHDLRPHADFVKVALPRVTDRRIPLRDDDDQVVVPSRSLDGADRCLTTDLERPDMAGQLDLGAKRNDRILTLGVL